MTFTSQLTHHYTLFIWQGSVFYDYYFCFNEATCRVLSLSTSATYFYTSFHWEKMVLSLKVRKVKTRNRKMKLCTFVLDHFCHELQTNYFPQSSRGISLVDPTQRLFHPNPLPCLFYLVDSSSVIIQIHALPPQRRQSCNDGLVQEQQLGLFFSQFFSLEKANILESQKSCQIFSSLLFNLRKMDSRAVNKYLHSVKCWLVIHWFYTIWWTVADCQHSRKSGRRTKESNSGGKAQLW